MNVHFLPSDPPVSLRHSPLPWRAGETYARFIYPRFEVDGDLGFAIVQCGNGVERDRETDEANAKFIATACNQHDALVAQRDALLAAVKQWGVFCDAMPGDMQFRIGAALELLKARQLSEMAIALAEVSI